MGLAEVVKSNLGSSTFSFPFFSSLRELCSETSVEVRVEVGQASEERHICEQKEGRTRYPSPEWWQCSRANSCQISICAWATLSRV